MKRSAESQLTRENLDDEEANSSDGPREFQRASQKELAKRVIKPLPNRRGGSGSPAPSSAPPSSLPAFGSTVKPSSTLGDTAAPSSSTPTLPSLGVPVLPSLPAGGFTFKPPGAAGSSPFSLPSIASAGASKATLPAFTGFGAPLPLGSGVVASTGSSGGFSFKLPTTAAPTNGPKPSTAPSGGLPPFKPPTSSSSTPSFSFGSKPPVTEKPSSGTPTPIPTFSFGAPPTSSAKEAPPNKAASAGLKPPSPSTLSGKATASSVPPSKPAPPPPNMTATAKSMSSIFSSMTSESPPRPSLPGFKAPDGGIAISPEKGSAPGISKTKTGSFSFGGGIPKKPAANDAQAKPKVDKGKGKATNSTGTFGLRSFPNSPVDDVIEERIGHGPNGPLPNGLNPNNEGESHFRRGTNDPPSAGIDAGDFDPSLNDDGSPSRKPYHHPEHQEEYEGDKEMKYWIHLRGLNTSFLREIIRRQREDPFTDMSTVFKSYKEFRKGVIGEMVECLRANGKGDGTESAEEESDSEDEEMEYDDGEQEYQPEDDYMQGTDEEQLYAEVQQQQQQQKLQEEQDRDKTPPGGVHLPRAPVGGLYMFGGKPVSSFSGAGEATATTGVGFKPSGAAAEFKPPPPARYSFKSTHPSTNPPVAVPDSGGFTPAAPSKGSSSTSSGGFTPSQPWTKPFGGSTAKAPEAGVPVRGGFAPAASSKSSGFTSGGFTPTQPWTKPFGSGTAKAPGAGSSAPSSGSAASGGGFTPMDTTGSQPALGASTSTPTPPTTSAFAPHVSSGSGFSFKPATTGGFSFGKPPAPIGTSAAGMLKEPDASPKSPPAPGGGAKMSSFPGFGPITGGPSGSPFGTKPAASADPKSPPSPTAFSGSSFSFGSTSGSTFGGFGTGSSAGRPSASGGATAGVGPFGSSTTSKSSAFGSTGDHAKPSSSFGSFGNRPSSVWAANTPEAAKPGSLFGAPPANTTTSLFGSGPSPGGGSIFGAKPTTGTGPSPFDSGSVFGSTSSSSSFGGGSTSAFGSGATTTSSGDPSKPSQGRADRFGDTAASSTLEGASKTDDNSDGKDELEEDEDEATTPKATSKALPSSDAPRGGISNPWATAPATSSIAPAAGGPFKFGMGSKPAAADPEVASGSSSSKSSGFSFADPPAGFKLPSAGAFSFADPPAGFKLPSAGAFSFADPPKSTTGTSTFINPFASPPKTGTLPGFSAISGGFGSGFSGFGPSSADAGTGGATASKLPPLFGGSTNPSGTFSFGTAPLPTGPFFPSSTTGGLSQAKATSASTEGFGATSGGAATDTGADSTALGSSQESDVAPEGGAGVGLGEDKFDQPGPGEEMEESLFTVRGKVMKFAGLSWVDMGIGQIRLYKHRETDAKRVFARNSKSGRIILNFAPFAKMEPKVDDQKPKFMRMTAMDEGKLVKVLVKLKEGKDAVELVSVLQKEVESLS